MEHEISEKKNRSSIIALLLNIIQYVLKPETSSMTLNHIVRQISNISKLDGFLTMAGNLLDNMVKSHGL